MSKSLIVETEAVDRLTQGECWDPLAILGPHYEQRNGTTCLVVRVFAPEAAAVVVVPEASAPSPIAMSSIHPAGLFEAVCPEDMNQTGYRLRVTDSLGKVVECHDPYAFSGWLTDLDRHLFAEGRLYRAYEKLGAHPCQLHGVPGVAFAVWAPNARRVSVVGDFNAWDARRHPLQSLGGTGLWELFIPDLSEREIYKFAIRPRDHEADLLKADPYAAFAELRPRTGSIVWNVSGFPWQDDTWMHTRTLRNPLSCPLAIYEVHLGSWRRVPEEGNRWLTYRELADQLIPYVKDMGYTHIELLPVTEHPFDGSWGYQTTGYFAPTSRYGTPQDFMAFVDACHQAGIGVLMDWAPAHFPDDPHGLAWFDGTHLYDHEDPRRGFHPEWNSRIFNYGRNEVRNFLINSALSWLDRYHIDGLRVDAVASMLYLDYARKPGEWVPNHFGGNENLEAVAFLKELNEVVHREYPGVMMIAEESTAWSGVSRPVYTGGLGFTFKWNMGWMHDTLAYFRLDPIHRKYHHNHLTFGLVYAFHENFVLVLSHDEVVHGKKSLLDKMTGTQWQQFANLRTLYGLMYGHPGKKMLFMGGEIGQWWEWNHESSVQWHCLEYPDHAGLQRYVADLNRLYVSQPALYEVDCEARGFEWIDLHDAEQSTLSFLRRANDPEDFIVCVLNCTPVPREGYRLGVPAPGVYRELLNSDASCYGGSNMGNGGAVQAEEIPWHGRPYSTVMTLPPLSALFLKPAVSGGST